MGQILRLNRVPIIRDMFTPQKGQLLQLEGLGIAQVLEVFDWVEDVYKHPGPIDGNPVPFVTHHTLEIYIAPEVHRVEVHVYYEIPGEVLQLSWNRIGDWTGSRRSVRVL